MINHKLEPNVTFDNNCTLAKNTIEVVKDLNQIKSILPSSMDATNISNIFQIGTLLSSISTITGFNPLILIIFVILYKIILSIHLKKIINKYKINNSIETLTINIYNLPITTTDVNPTPQFEEYLSIVNYLKLKNIQKTQYIADYAGKFNFLNNLTNIKINNLIWFSSTYSTNSSNTTINCSIILYSNDICALRAFVKKCMKIYKKQQKHEKSYSSLYSSSNI
jgi:hypothetical protein